MSSERASEAGPRPDHTKQQRTDTATNNTAQQSATQYSRDRQYKNRRTNQTPCRVKQAERRRCACCSTHLCRDSSCQPDSLRRQPEISDTHTHTHTHTHIHTHAHVHARAKAHLCLLRWCCWLGSRCRPTPHTLRGQHTTHNAQPTNNTLDLVWPRTATTSRRGVVARTVGVQWAHIHSKVACCVQTTTTTTATATATQPMPIFAEQVKQQARTTHNLLHVLLPQRRCQQVQAADHDVR